MADSGGILLKSDEGDLYFVRDEILAACKVEGEYLEGAQKMAEAQESDVEGFAFNPRQAQFSQAGNFSSANLNLKATQLNQDVGNIADKVNSMSTIMCPW